MIQLGPDLLVINRLRPYTGFDDWRPNIDEMMDRYRQLAKPESIERIGLRYINQITIPSDPVLMQDYFTIYPVLPKDLGEDHGPFMIRVEIPQQTGDHAVTVTFATAKATQPNESRFLLDLYDRIAVGVEFENLPKVIASAHEEIVRAFEGSITDKLRELFEVRN